MNRGVRNAGAALGLGWRASPPCSAARIALTVLAAVATPVAAWIGKLLVDELALGRDGSLSRVTTLAVAGAVLAVTVVMIGHLLTYVTVRHQAAITVRAEGDLFQRVCSFVGLRYFEDPDFQDRLMLAEQSASDAPGAVAGVVQSGIRSGISLAGFLAIIASVWPAMAALLLAAAIPGLLAEARLARRHVRASQEMSALDRRRFFYRSMLTDDRAAKEVRLFGLGSFFRTRQVDALRRSQRLMVGLAGRTAVVQSLLNLLGGLLSGFGIIVVARRVMSGELTPGDVLLFMAAIGGVQTALSDLVTGIGEASRALRLFGCFDDVMRTPPDLPAGPGAAGPLRNGVRFEDVWFRYDERGPWVLRGVTFELPAGTSTGLVGVNGAGKSTIVKLLCRFYDPGRGRILWDGTDLRDLDPDALRLRMAATFQDFMTYDLSVGENIGVGDLTQADDPAAIRRSARQADIDDAITRFPRGYRTMLSRVFFEEEEREPGVTLSGGQWQRVALARSLLRAEADLLILDEPSSGLDAEAEYRVHQTLREFRQGRTSLLISHRLGSLRAADHIVVVDGGVVAEQGSHDELMLLDGTYRRLFTTQARGYAETAVP